MASKQFNTLNIGDTLQVNVNASYQELFGETMIFRIIDKNHAGAPENSVSLITENVIQLAAFDGKESSNPDSARQLSGNNKYSLSNIMQFLNSSVETGWYTGTHTYDAPPNTANVQIGLNPYDTKPGFLSIFSEFFRSNMMETNVSTVDPVFEGGTLQNAETIFFLLSKTEVGFQNELNLTEGTLMDYFKTNLDAMRVAYPNQAAITNSNYRPGALALNRGWSYSLRTPVSDTTDSVYSVSNTGAMAQFLAFQGQTGLRPAVNVNGNMIVSDSPNDEGHYVVIEEGGTGLKPTTPTISTPPAVVVDETFTISWTESTDPNGNTISYILEKSIDANAFTILDMTNETSYEDIPNASDHFLAYRVKAVNSVNIESDYSTSPIINILDNPIGPPFFEGEDGDLGSKSEGFAYSYLLSRGSNNPIIVEEKINDTILREYVATVGVETFCNITGNTFTECLMGINTLTITATDGLGFTVVKTVTFTKNVNYIYATRDYPIQSKIQPKQVLIRINATYSDPSVLRIEATNNAFDENPDWENCTNAVLNGEIYNFQNMINQSEFFGGNIRVTLERNSADGECSITKLEGSFI